MLKSRAGEIEVPLEISDEMHARRGRQPAPRLGPRPRRHPAAGRARTPGASVNDVTDGELVDALSGNAAFSGVPVEVTPLRR